MKRFIAIMLALLLCAAINPALALPTPDYDSSMSFSFALGANGDSTSVTIAPGDILTLKVSVARVDAVSEFQMYALMTETVYNSAYFELVQDSAQMKEIAAHTAVAVSPVKLGEETVMKLSYDTNSAAGSQVQSSFTVGTFQLKVKELPTGSAGISTSVRLQNCYFCTEDGMKRYVTAAEGSVAVTIGTPSAGSYNIAVTQPTEGGTITAPASAKAGETVTLSVSLRDGYTVNSWYVIGVTDLKTTNTERTTAVFSMPSRDVTVSISLNAPSGGGSGGGGGGGGGSAAGPAAQPSIDITDETTPLSGASFTDVAPGHWAYQFVEYLALRGYINGKTETEFMPNALITRAEFITILARMSGETLPEAYTGAFTDIKHGSYYEGAVAWGVKNGITNGVTETTFNPNDNITRQQIAAMLSRYAEYKQYTLARQIDAPDFIDNADIADYAKNPVREMQGAGIIGGYEDGAFRPKNNATRAEAAKMLGVLHYLMDN